MHMTTSVKSILLVAGTLLALGTLSAQTYDAQGARGELRKYPLLAGSNYTAYDNAYQAFDHTMTPAPEGYTPFYISTYMRHGSRWLTSAKDYTRPILFLEDADLDGRLTRQGKQLLKELHQLLNLSPTDKLGVLTDVGFAQHNGIASRMCERYPTIFNKSAYVHARSSYVARCVKSMAEEAEVIYRMSRANVIQESGKAEWQDYLAHGDLQSEIKAAQKGVKALLNEADEKYLHPERLMKVLLKKPGETTPDEQRKFMRDLFELATNMQSHHFDLDLMRYFTEEEIYALWKVKNINWYLKNGYAPQTGSIAPWRQRWLLEDFIGAADTLVDNRKFHGATLRFGHEGCLMPLVALMELGTLNSEVQDLDTLDRVWRNYEIFPMAGNVQLVFYRAGKNDDILVKALLNEREIALPGTPVSGPYYRWKDVRNYWKNKLYAH